MKLPSTFLPGQERLETKLKDLMKRENEKDGKKELHLPAEDIPELEALKKGTTREEQEKFLKLFVNNIPELIGLLRRKMGLTKTRSVYMEPPCQGDRAELTLENDGHLYFHHLMYKADLDDKELYRPDGFSPIYDYLNTHPDKDYGYHTMYGDLLCSSFKSGTEMYESMIEFLRYRRN